MTTPTKSGRGRPRKPDAEKVQTISTSLPPAVVAWLATLGDGKATRGMRRVLLAAHRAAHPLPTPDPLG